MAPRTERERKWPDLARRFGYYFVGLAIGLMLLGMFAKLRKGEMESRGIDPETQRPVQKAPAQPAAATSATSGQP